MKFIDYYKVLGVDENADGAQIKKAYRRLARKYHPDVSKEADAEEQFKKVSEAYEVLHDDKRRAEYDQLRRYGGRPGEEFRPPPGWHAHAGGFSGGAGSAGAGGFSDFFEAIFGNARASAAAGAGARTGGFRFEHDLGGDFTGQGGQQGGQDNHHQLEVTLEEAFSGGNRRLQIQDGGSGQVRSLDVRIPKGVTDGQKIRLRGQGGPGRRGGDAGDLYLEIRIQPHRLYQLDGRDLHLKLPVAPWEAALGAEVPVPTLAGPVQLKVPANSRAGRRMRLKGRGLPTNPPGDLIVEVQITMPAHIDDEGRALMEKMRDAMAFNPRAELGV